MHCLFGESLLSERIVMLGQQKPGTAVGFISINSKGYFETLNMPSTRMEMAIRRASASQTGNCTASCPGREMGELRNTRILLVRSRDIFSASMNIGFTH